MTDPSNSGFFRRWSSRKSDARQGRALPPEPAQDTSPLPAVQAREDPATDPVTHAPPPTLDDVGKLGQDSDFSAFVQRQVPADVKNAAMKKLFADPHFNVMDGLDVYIDDYSLPDPLAPAILRQMASAQFLKLVDETPETPQPPPQSVAQCDPLRSSSEATEHDHADLRLQPDPAAGSQSSGAKPV